MKWYSHKAYRIHMKDMEIFKDDQELRSAYQDWPKVISNRFDMSYPRIGVLNSQDLLQEGYVGFYKAWKKIDWELIANSPEPERIGMITNYLKLSIKRHIIRAITRDRDTIRIPENYYMENPYGYKSEWSKYNKERQTDIFLTRTFASFFTQDFLDVADDHGDYISDQLNHFLNNVMDTFLTEFEKTIIKQSYGIDEPYDKKRSIKRIAEYYNKSEIWIKKTKAKGIKKLKHKEVKEIIEKKIDLLYT